MYVGRIVGVGRTTDGRLVSGYRVSSRSFPNRDAERSGRSIQIVPRAGSRDALSDSPYIAYECLVWNERFAVVSNGTHTRPIFERLRAGNSPRDAMVSVLSGLDREFDEHDTPRICGLMDIAKGTSWLGSITATSLAVRPVNVANGQMAYITTYGFPLPLDEQADTAFQAASADDVCRHLSFSSVFSEFEKPICSAACIATADGIETSTFNII